MPKRKFPGPGTVVRQWVTDLAVWGGGFQAIAYMAGEQDEVYAIVKEHHVSVAVVAVTWLLWKFLVWDVNKPSR